MRLRVFLVFAMLFALCIGFDAVAQAPHSPRTSLDSDKKSILLHHAKHTDAAPLLPALNKDKKKRSTQSLQPPQKKQKKLLDSSTKRRSRGLLH